MVGQSHASQSGPPDISSTHLAPYVVNTALLTVFPVLTLHPCDYFVTTNLYFLIPSPFYPDPQPLSPLTTISLFTVSMSLSSLFVYFAF